MNKLIRTAIIPAIVLAAASCSKNANTIIARIATIATASDGKLISDGGETFIINSGAGNRDLSSGRFFVVCDLISNRGGNTYDVNVLGLTSALVKDIRDGASALEQEILVSDPINVESIWMSGGYVNMETLLFCIVDSDTKHLLNLVLDTGRSNADTLFFDIRHNAHGERPDNPSFSAREFAGGLAYACFPLSSLPSPIEKKTVFKFRFPGYDNPENFSKKDYSITSSYDPAG